MAFAVHQEIRLTATFRDGSTGQLTDPAVVIFKVIDNRGAVIEYTHPIQDSVGIYHQDILLTSGGGPWSYRAEGSGGAVGANEASFPVSATAFSG